MKKLRILSIIVLLAGLATFTISTMARKSKDKQYQPLGFTLIQTESLTLAEADPVQVGIWTRIANKRGEWKHTIQRFNEDGTISVQENVGTERGVYKVFREANGAPAKLELLSAWAEPDSGWYSSKFYRSSPDFVREEQILGYTAFVLRSETHGPGAWTEHYYIPKLGPTWVKMVDYRPDSETMTVEPVSIELREPRADFLKVPAFPVSYDSMREKIDNLQRSGRKEAAEAFRRQLSSVQNK